MTADHVKAGSFTFRVVNMNILQDWVCDGNETMHGLFNLSERGGGVWSVWSYYSSLVLTKRITGVGRSGEIAFYRRGKSQSQILSARRWHDCHIWTWDRIWFFRTVVWWWGWRRKRIFPHRRKVPSTGRRNAGLERTLYEWVTGGKSFFPSNKSWLTTYLDIALSRMSNGFLSGHPWMISHSFWGKHPWPLRHSAP